MKKTLTILLVFLILFPANIFPFLDSFAGDLLKQAGKEAAKQAEKAIFDQDNKPVHDWPLLEEKEPNEYAKRLLVKLLETEGSGSIEARIYLDNTNQVQGWTNYLSDEIHITAGMLFLIENEAMLAALISHEIGHHALQHEERRFKNSPISGMISRGLKEAVKDGWVREIVDRNQKEIIKSGWGQEMEQESDRYGAELAAKAGYDPYQFVRLFQKLSSYVNSDLFYRLKKFKGSHKALDERAANLEKFLEDKGYKKNTGIIAADAYLAGMGVLQAQAAQSENRDLKRIAEITAEAEQHKKNNTRLDQDKFILLVDELVKIAKEKGISKQELREALSGRETEVSGLFMEEDVSVNSPLWGGNALAAIVNGLKALGRIGVGAVPAVGDTLDLYEILTGTDAFTGELLSPFERTMSCMGVLAGSGAMWREVGQGINEQLAKYAVKNADEARAALKNALDNFESSADVKRGYCKSLNKKFLKENPGAETPYMDGASYYEMTLDNDRTLYRAYSKNMEGGWLLDFNPAGMSGSGIKDIAAMPEIPASAAAAFIPAGTKIRMSVAGKNSFGSGGLMQYEILDVIPEGYKSAGIMFKKIGVLK